MPDENPESISLIDVTAKFMPKKIKHIDRAYKEVSLLEITGNREKFKDNIERMYEDLAGVIEKTFLVTMPKFDQDMFKLINFINGSNSGISAEHNPRSGLISISMYHNKNLQDAMLAMAHEMCHFASLRKILTKGSDEVPARIGVSVIGNRVASPDGKTPFKFQRYRGNVINEALTDEMSVEIVNQIRGNYDFIPHEELQSKSYINERRLYSALLEAIVYSWNNDSLREEIISEREFWKQPDESRENNRSRMIAIKQRLNWGNQIDTKQVDQIFRDAMTNGDGLTKISHLINSCLEDNAFKEMWDAQPGETNDKAWYVLRPFSQAKAYAKEKLSITIGDIQVKIEGNDTKDNIIFHTYEEQDGTKLGIQDIFANYERLLSIPIPKEQLNLYAERANQRRRFIPNEYPFKCGLPIIHEASKNSILDGNPMLDFCFDKLKETLGVQSNPSETTTITVLGTKYTTAYYTCDKNPEVMVAMVRIDDEINDSTNTRYFFVK